MRHTLDSLERQYATGAPHRPISPDTIVMLANNEPLLLPAPEEVGPGSAASLPADLHALALVVHYAITAELPPDGPLGPRLYDDYSTQLTNGLDRCLGPNQRLRPKTIAGMRALLGIETVSGEAPVHASTVPAALPEASRAQPAQEAFAPLAETPAAADTAPLDPLDTAAPPAGFAAEQQQAAAPVVPDYGQPVPSPVTQEVRPVPAAPVAPATERLDAPEAAPRLHTPSSTDTPAGAPAGMAAAPAAAPTGVPASPPAPDTPLLRTPAAATTARFAAPDAAGDAARASAPTSLEAATAARLHEEAVRRQAAPAAPRAKSGNVQRWGWIAGAAIVLLAAGTALVSFLQQSDSRDMVPLSLPPAERAANGLDTGETVVAPRAGAADPGAGEVAPDATLPAETGAAGAPDAAIGAEPGSPALAGMPGSGSEAVVNGTTYKLLIKPWGTVYVDGIDRGVSPPVKRLTLGRGKHTIRIVNPNFPEHVVNVNAGTRESTTIEHDFTAKAE